MDVSKAAPDGFTGRSTASIFTLHNRFSPRMRMYMRTAKINVHIGELSRAHLPARSQVNSAAGPDRPTRRQRHYRTPLLPDGLGHQTGTAAGRTPAALAAPAERSAATPAPAAGRSRGCRSGCGGGRTSRRSRAAWPPGPVPRRPARSASPLRADLGRRPPAWHAARTPSESTPFQKHTLPKRARSLHSQHHSRQGTTHNASNNILH